MEETFSGIDKFEIRWQAFKLIGMEHKGWRIASTFALEAEKPKKKSLLDFFHQYQAYCIMPKYFINGKCFTTWWNDEPKGGLLDREGGRYSMLARDFINDDFTYLKIMIHRLLGNLLDQKFVKNLRQFKEWDEEGIEYIMKEENEDIQLFGCPCGDRGCGYFGMKTHKKNQYITWSFYGNEIRNFVFIYDEYKKEFEELIKLIEAREKYRKQDWIKHFLQKRDSDLIQVPNQSEWNKKFGFNSHELR